MTKSINFFMMKTMPNYVSSTLGIAGLTVGIFAVTKNPLTSPFALQFTLLTFLIFIFYNFYARKKGQVVLESKIFTYLLTLAVLSLVAATGWFFSPFFFSLYLLSIYLTFVLPASASVAFVFTLVALFSFNVGEVDLSYDFLIVLSLLAVIPLGFYLKKQFLKLKQAEKEVLILKKEDGHDLSEVQEVLANKVNELAVSLRQPVNDVKQLAYHLKQAKTPAEREESQQRIIVSSEEALRLLKKFEEETTDEKLLSTPETS